MLNVAAQDEINIPDFKLLSVPLNEHLTDMLTRPDSSLAYYLDVNLDEMWNLYLDSFPEGTNPVYRERTLHDCSCCRNFFKNMANVVTINDGKIVSVWDCPNISHPFDVVVTKLREYIENHLISNVYLTTEKSFGKEKTYETLEGGGVKTWDHFFIGLPKHLINKEPQAKKSKYLSTSKVFKRGLNELSLSAIETVSELISEDAIYRGEEHKKSISEFLSLIRQYSKLNSEQAQDIFIWKNITNANTRFKNTVIGTLIEDISNGVDVEKAVKKFEAKVAPANYKRPKSLITKRMVDKAIETINEMGIEGSLQRRHATISDVSINDVLFVDNSLQGQMVGGLESLLMEAVKHPEPKLDNPIDISIEDFMSTVVPNVSSIDLYLENRHFPNFVSITAPVNEDSPNIFKWDNNFAWSYDGDLADSQMTQEVNRLGGRTDGVFRFTHSWNYDKRNASLMDLHVFLPNSNIKVENDSCNDIYGNSHRVGWNLRSNLSTGGNQDVDYTAIAPVGYIPVENITFPAIDKMPNGRYVCKIHNWSLREPSQGGFRAEIACGGEVYEYEYSKPLANKEWVTVAVVNLNNGVFTIDHKLEPSTNSKAKWGIDSKRLVPVETIMFSPNYWSGSKDGNKHHFFMLKDCKNPEPTRGIYNEYLKAELNDHRKTFEVLGSKTKCPYSDDQLSGLGFSSTKRNTVTLVAKSNKSQRVYNVSF